jgi:integrase
VRGQKSKASSEAMYTYHQDVRDRDLAGLRVGEPLALTGQDVEFDQWHLTVVVSNDDHLPLWQEVTRECSAVTARGPSRGSAL